MTGYTVHTGASKKFVSGWDRIFGDSTSGKAASEATQKKPRAKKASGKKKKKS
jgi:hypothetical protein